MDNKYKKYLTPPVVLAPMAGITDPPFRQLVKEYGVGLLVTEMVAAEAVVRAHKKTLAMAVCKEEERPIAIQLFGADPVHMAEAAHIVEDYGADMIDINMGCPVKKVTKNGAGAALMQTPELAAELVDKTANAVSIPVTVKMRLGWDNASCNAPELAKMCASAGAFWVAVHGRTRAQLYAGRADWNAVAAVKEDLSVPLIANGDVFAPEDAIALREKTGAEGVMLGRGMLGRPWFAGQVAAALAGEPVPEDPTGLEKGELACRHVSLLCAHYGDYAGLRIARKHLCWYAKGMRSGNQFRNRVNKLENLDDTLACVRDFFAEGP